MQKNKHKASYKLNREAPEEFKLWSAGENPTDYGVHIWNERSCQEVLAQYERRGNLLGLDIEHTGSSDSPFRDDPNRPTAGYCQLEIRDGEPWIIFDWSDIAKEQIESGQRRYLSPEYYTDPDTKEIIGLERVSLVHEPGTWGIKLLCSKNKTNNGINFTARISMNEKDLKLAGSVLLALKMAAEQAADEAIKKMMAEAMQMLMSALGDSAQPAMDLASEKEEVEVEAEAAPEEKKEDIQAEMAPEEKKEDKKPEEKAMAAKKIASLENQVQVLTSKIEGLLAGISAGKLGASSIKTKVAPPEMYGLSLAEMQRCKEKGLDPEKYAASKAKIVFRK